MEGPGQAPRPGVQAPRTATTRTTTATMRPTCDATSFYLGATLLLSVASMLGLLVGFLSDHWELVRFDNSDVDALASRQGLALTRSRNVVRIARSSSREDVIFLVNLNGGVHRICASLDDDDLAFLGDDVKRAPVGCISYYALPSADDDFARRSPVVVRYPWLDRMRNLAMSCSLVSLILMGASAVVGGFGICKRQLSAVMVTGVMFILSAVFGVFTTCFMHFKRTGPRGVVTGTDFDLGLSSEYLRARRFSRDWSATVSCAGIALCLLTSVFWLILARIMRF